MSLLRLGRLSLSSTLGRPVLRRSIWRFQSRKYAIPLPQKLSEPMADAYDPSRVEKDWYEWWEHNGFFKPKIDTPAEKGKFSMVLPPPNVTGYLHIGHALTVALEDAAVRYNRMKGRATVWVPGLDHAGIATQTVVEKYLMQTQNKHRRDMSRDEFIEHVWRWKEKHGGQINNQLKRTGASLDWSREVFTLDANLSRAVTEAFVRLHDDGLIYRSTRLVNWDCKLQTVISDIEIDFEEVTAPKKLNVPGRKKGVEVGVIHYLLYPVEGMDRSQWLKVATTRPETILGDTAVAIHPEDERYKAYHGKMAINPMNGRRIPIVLDSTLVNMELGTGVVKVTPAHDPEDYECGLRHNLPFINILNDDGTLNSNAGTFETMDRFDAREAVVQALQKEGLYIEKKPNPMKIAVCSRSKDILEPRLKPQWYVRCKEMGAKSLDLVQSGQIEMLPDIFRDEWERWMRNVRDWCISRQLWWGHRVPAWRVVRTTTSTRDTDDHEKEAWVAARSEQDALERAKAKYGLKEGEFTLKQDDDVLDTWFSSGLFPLSALGWPSNQPDVQEMLKRFYPLNLMETGHDIMFFWVARMTMLCTHLVGDEPFNRIFLHAVLRDAHGRKMSKSLGNVIDPIHVMEGISLDELKRSLTTGNLDPREVEKAAKGMETDFPDGIPQCGADALRLTLAQYTRQGRNVNMDVKKVVANRHFCNKLWNATKFALGHFATATSSLRWEPRLVSEYAPQDPILSNGIDSLFVRNQGLPPLSLKGRVFSLLDSWILHRLYETIRDVDKLLAALDFSEAANKAYSFFLYDLCDNYIELIKLPLMEAAKSGAQSPPDLVNQCHAKLDTLYTCLDVSLKLLHPFMPFVTEELWHRLPSNGQLRPDSLIIAPFPSESQFSIWNSPQTSYYGKHILDLISSARSLRQVLGYTKETKSELTVETDDETLISIIKSHDPLLRRMLPVGQISFRPFRPQGDAHVFSNEGLRSISDKCRVTMPAPKANVDAEIAKSEKILAQLRQRLSALVAQVAGATYSQRVPLDVQEKNTAKMEGLKQEIDKLETSIRSLKTLAT